MSDVIHRINTGAALKELRELRELNAELLATLKELVDDESPSPDHSCQMYDDARGLIAKAEKLK